ncbi:phosphoribosylamine/glycine ligase [Chthoniobacter flavus Ellin428]|uniref:Phosphoribosylamine--glycine ligase n=1 Tax=Chthoniobacter flavus Ellin428 TaxID=497964 RepID=B4D0W3_9BACT|nr:phosphoribosylamine--glycine ligase [Chthoniobacter flavus]EDY19975.1 phosphoribosylamine/glycine ligase [Chthoniobacter flavus Ellin428]TCO91756.1 phosphoribosylamine--glycine ligase [Chthoniobacter flavus]
MKILVLGSGGREHALVWKLRQSPRVTALYCAPGNAGTAQLATNVPIKITEHQKLVEFAKSEGIDLTVVGPDDALAAGIVDLFQKHGLRIFGPTQSAARLESSKVFAKEFMERHGIPTARSGSFSDSSDAQRFCQKAKHPLVVKADGLALGKGVIIAQNSWEAGLAVHEIMDVRKFGDAGKQVLIEEFLEGEECSIHALVDGDSYLLFPAAQDHKRALDGDQGLNTGGMGTFSPPSKLLTPELEERVRREVLDPFIAGLKKDGLDFRGMLFPGLMITADGPKVLEFNCRFGDPETQVLLTRLESDLVDLLEATIDRRLAQTKAQWKTDSAVCVVMASGGYPGSYASGKAITGLEQSQDGITVFHAGTKAEGGKTLTAGGRVLGVTALAGDLAAARQRAYAAVDGIQFEGRQFRRDIAVKGLSA